MSISTWDSHSPCFRCFLNLPQGVCGIQMELPIATQILGRGVLTLTWYMYICLPFEVFFHEIWYSDQWVFINDEEVQIQKLGVFWASYCKKHHFFFWQNWVLFHGKRYTDGRVIG